MLTTPSEQATPAEPAPPLSLRLGHPVRNFLLVLAVVIAPLFAAWRTGALTPRLELRDARALTDTCRREGIISFDVVNPTPFAVDVKTIRVVLVAHSSEARPRDLALDDGGTPTRLAAGEHRRVVLRSRVAEGTYLTSNFPHVTFTARTFLGLTRTVTKHNVYVRSDADRPCPPG